MAILFRSIAAIVAAVAAFTGPPAVAGADACRSATSECYQKVQLPDEYANVDRQVVVAPGRQEVVHTPALVGTRSVRVQVAPGIVRAVDEPAMMGEVRRQVMVAPATASHVETPPVYKTVHQSVVVRPASVRWERKLDRNGVETMCKVEVPAETRTVARQVLASPGGRVTRLTPAVYREEIRSVVIRPSGVRHVYEPGRHEWAGERYLARPAATHVVQHPPVTTTVSERVLVRPGGTAWKRVDGHPWRNW